MMEREDRVCLLPGPESELAPLAPRTRSSVELWPGQLSTGLSGLATQDRWRGIISASQSAMAAVVGGDGGGRLSHSPCVRIHAHSQMHASTYSSPLLPQTQPGLLIFMRWAGR